MKVHKPFSELVSEKRLSIIQALRDKPMRFTKVSDKLEMRSPEASRQLTCLSDANLIEKRANENYCLTFLGKLTLSPISNLEFISEKSEYFLNHEPSPIPPHLLSQMDALSKGKIVTGLYETLNTVDELYEGVNTSNSGTWQMSFPDTILPKVEKKAGRRCGTPDYIPKEPGFDPASQIKQKNQRRG